VTAQRSRVLVIGIDGGTWDLLDPLMSDGTMPKLKDLLRGAARGVLRSVDPPLTPAAWSTVLTGKDPGGHGIFDFLRTFSGFSTLKGRDRYVVSSRLLPRPYLYDHLGNAGKRVISINVPLTYPPHEINGLMVTGMFTPRGSDFTHPASLREKLKDYEIDLGPGEGPQMATWLLSLEETAEPVPRLVPRASRRVLGKRTDTTLTLMKEEPWDFLFVVFTCPDRICHHFWRTMHDQSNPALADVNEEIRQFYRELDASIARLVDAAGPQASVLLVSDHGFGPFAKRKVNFDLWLEREKLAFRRRWAPLAILRKVPGNALARAAVKRLLTLLLPAHKHRRLIQRVEDRQTQRDRVTDNRRTLVRARTFWACTCGFDVNPELAPPGSQKYEEVRTHLIEKLRTLQDPETGENVVKEALPREEVYHGPFAATAPDVVARLHTDYMPRFDPWAKDKRFIGPLEHPERQGNHRYEGIFALISPHATKGQLPPSGLADIAPTVLYLFGLPIPDDMTGDVIRRAIRPDYIEGNPPRRCAVAEVGRSSEESAYSAEEEAEIEGRLRDIGYL